jgi:hypothetical protein
VGVVGSRVINNWNRRVNTLRLFVLGAHSRRLDVNAILALPRLHRELEAKVLALPSVPIRWGRPQSHQTLVLVHAEEHQGWPVRARPKWRGVGVSRCQRTPARDRALSHRATVTTALSVEVAEVGSHAIVVYPGGSAVHRGWSMTAARFHRPRPICSPRLCMATACS